MLHCAISTTIFSAQLANLGVLHDSSLSLSLFLPPWTSLVALEMAFGESVESFSVEFLEADHRQGFEQALMRVLKTGPAEHTFAEIIDGLPVKRSYVEFHWPQDGHPAYQHDEICPGVVERARELQSKFSVTKLRFKLPAS